jgi:lipoprotein-releasing system permease protein
VEMERLIMYLLLFMVMVVAAFCIMNTMITVTTQKKSEIGLMKAVGGPKSQIVGAFLGQGIVVGLFGTVAGHLLAMLFLYFRHEVAKAVAYVSGQDLFASAGMAMLYDLPAKITVVDVAVISGGAVFVCALAALVPACAAAKLEAADALRQEASI